MMFHALRGLGQTPDDGSGGSVDAPAFNASTGSTGTMPSVTDQELSLIASGMYQGPGESTTTGLPTTALTSGGPVGTPATGFNWGILASIIPSLAQTAGATTASVLNAQTNAQTAASIAAGQVAASQASTASSSTFMMLGLAAAAVVVVMVMAKGKGH